jgi:hypothetical protein
MAATLRTVNGTTLRCYNYLNCAFRKNNRKPQLSVYEFLKKY